MAAYWQPWNSVPSQDLRCGGYFNRYLNGYWHKWLVSKDRCLGDMQEVLINIAGHLQQDCQTPADANPVANPAITTTYTLTVTDLCGNTATSNVQVIANAAKPTIRITAAKDSICLGETVRLSATSNNNYYYQWFVNNQKIAGATDSFYVAQRTGNYQVSVTNGRGGCTNTSAVFFVKDCSIKLADNKADTACYSYFYPRLGL